MQYSITINAVLNYLNVTFKIECLLVKGVKGGHRSNNIIFPSEAYPFRSLGKLTKNFQLVLNDLLEIMATQKKILVTGSIDRGSPNQTLNALL